jgi:hypothetical protein
MPNHESLKITMTMMVINCVYLIVLLILLSRGKLENLYDDNDDGDGDGGSGNDGIGISNFTQTCKRNARC